MSELLHDLSLLEEGLGRHGARLQGLDGHLSGTVPRAWEVVGGERRGSMSVENNSNEFNKGANKFGLLEEMISRDGEKHNKQRKRLQEVDNYPVWTQTVNNKYVCLLPAKWLRFEGSALKAKLTHPHLSEAALAQLDLQSQGLPGDLPGILS